MMGHLRELDVNGINFDIGFAIEFFKDSRHFVLECQLVGDDAGVGLAVPITFDYVAVPKPDAIAEGMAKIISGRTAMERAARQRAVERFSLSHWFDRHETVFKRLLGEGIA